MNNADFNENRIPGFRRECGKCCIRHLDLTVIQRQSR